MDANVEGGTPVRIREAAVEDAGVVAEFNRALARETEAKELDPEVVRVGVETLLRDPALGRYWMAEDAGSGEAVGQIMVTTEWSDWRNAPLWWIQSVYVKPDRRRGGVYRALHAHVRERARAEGAIGLRLYVERENHGAQATYAALGMRPAGYLVFEELWL